MDNDLYIYIYKIERERPGTFDFKVDSKVGSSGDPLLREVLGAKTGHLLEHRGFLRRNHLVTAGGADLPLS